MNHPFSTSTHNKTTALIIATMLLTLGCNNSGVTPKEAEIAPEHFNKPIPLIIALRLNEKATTTPEWDMMPGLKCDLDDAKIFAQVLYPERSDDKPDGILKLKFSLVWDGDKIQTSRTILDIPLLPIILTIAAIKQYNEQWIAECDATLEINNKPFRQYHATGVAKVLHGAFNSTNCEQEAYGVAAKLMCNDLCKQLATDREPIVNELTIAQTNTYKQTTTKPQQAPPITTDQISP